jgi:hypothetical protein
MKLKRGDEAKMARLGKSITCPALDDSINELQRILINDETQSTGCSAAPLFQCEMKNVK